MTPQGEVAASRLNCNAPLPLKYVQVRDATNHLVGVPSVA